MADVVAVSARTGWATQTNKDAARSVLPVILFIGDSARYSSSSRGLVVVVLVCSMLVTFELLNASR
jgi:hypothetical protein